MEELTLFSIHTPWRQSHKWDVGDDGLVDYEGERITPREALDRFREDYPMFRILRADVCKRLDEPSEITGRDYTWIQLERFA